MSLDQVLAMLAFGFAMSATPGPNTMMLLASGVNFGFAPTIPHMFGILFGLGFMLVAVSLGLGALLMAVPQLVIAMKVASIFYMLWLSYRIATSGPTRDGPVGASPMTLTQAALFQWVNPKAWAMALTGIAAYTQPENYAVTTATFIAILLLLSLPVTAAWTGLGVGLRGLLARPSARRTFNISMAALLVGSLWPIVRDLTG